MGVRANLTSLKGRRFGHRYAQRKAPCEQEGRDGDNASRHQGMPKIVRKPPETRQEAWNRFSMRQIFVVLAT